MLDIEKLEYNFIDLINFLENKELLKNEKFYDIYNLNLTVKNNFLFLIKNLEQKKIKNIKEIKVKLLENIKYFSNFSFIKKKYNLNQIHNLESLKQLKENNKIVSEIINYFKKKQLNLPGIIFLGYQTTEKVNDLIKNINFFNFFSKKDFDLAISKIKQFNNIEKTNAINYYQNIYNNVSNNSELLSKLTKINKKYFAFREYKYFESQLKDTLTDNFFSDVPIITNLEPLNENEKNIAFSNIDEIIKKLETLSEKKIFITELAKSIGIDKKNNKNFFWIEELCSIFSSKNKDNLREDIENFNYNFTFYYYNGTTTENAESLSINLKDNIQNIFKNIDAYFESIENYFKNLTLIFLLDSYYLIYHIDKNNYENIFQPLLNDDETKLFKIMEKYFPKHYFPDSYFHLKNTASVEDVALVEHYLQPENTKTIKTKINNYLNNHTFLKKFNEKTKKKLVLLKKEINYLYSSLNLKSNPEINEIKNELEIFSDHLDKILYFIPLTSLSEDNYEPVNIDFLVLLLNNYQNTFDKKNFNNIIKTTLNKEVETEKIFFNILSNQISITLENILTITTNEFNKFKYSEEFKTYLNDPDNKDLIDNFQSKDEFTGWKNLKNFEFERHSKLRDVDININKIIRNFSNNSGDFSAFEKNVQELKQILVDYYFWIDWNLQHKYRKAGKLILSIFYQEIDKNNLGVSHLNYFDKIIKKAKNWVNLPAETRTNDKINLILDENEQYFFNPTFHVKNFFLSQKNNIEIAKNGVLKLFEENKKYCFDLNSNLFIKNFITEEDYNNFFPVIEKVENIKKLITDEDYKKWGKNLLNDLNNVSFVLSSNNWYNNGNNHLYENFFKKFTQELLTNKLDQINDFNDTNINNLKHIIDISTFFDEIYNLDAIFKIKPDNFKQSFLYFSKLKNISEKFKDLKDFDEYKTNFFAINTFIKEATKIKDDIEADPFTDVLINYKIDANDSLFQEKTKIIDALKKQQLKEIFVKNKLTFAILKKHFPNDKHLFIDINFFIEHKDEIENIQNIYEHNKKEIIELKNDFETKYQFFNSIFQLKTKEENEFLNLNEYFDEIINNEDENFLFSVSNNYLNNFSFTIDFQKPENDFKNEELKNLNYVVKKFFDYLFATYIFEYTKTGKDKFSLIIWEKIIKENEDIKNLYQSWINNSFVNEFTKKNIFLENFETNFSSFLNLKNELDEKFKIFSNLNLALDDLLIDKEDLFFFKSSTEIENYDNTILEGTDAENIFFLNDFKNDLNLAIETKNFDILKKYDVFDLNQINDYDEIVDHLKIFIEKLLEKNIQFANNIFSNVNKIFQEKLAIVKGNNFINYVLTSTDNNKLKLLFDKFNENNILNFDNLKIINNFSIYKNYFDLAFYNTYDKNKIVETVGNIKKLFELSSIFEKYFLVSAKAFLYLNSDLIDQNTLNNYLLPSTDITNYKIKNKYLTNKYFDFSDPKYVDYLEKVDPEYTLKNIKWIHDQLFLDIENLDLFYKKISSLIKFNNDPDSKNFQDSLDLNNQNLKKNYLKINTDQLLNGLSGWNEYFLKFFYKYKIFNRKSSYIKQEYFKIINSELAIEKFIDYDPDIFISEVDLVIEKFSINKIDITLDYDNEILSKLVIDLKTNLLNDLKFNFLKDNSLNNHQLREIKSILPVDLKLYFLQEEDLSLSDKELAQKYSTSNNSEYIFKSTIEKRKFFDELEKYSSYDEYKKHFYHKIKIILEYFKAKKNVKNNNYSDFFFLFDFKNLLIKKYQDIKDSNDNSFLVDFINQTVDDSILINIAKEVLDSKLQIIRTLKNDLVVMNEIKNKLIKNNSDQEIHDLFFNDQGADLIIDKHKKDNNLLTQTSSSKFSKVIIYHKIDEYMNIGKKSILLSNLQLLKNEINNVQKEKYYQEIFLINLNKEDIFLEILTDIDSISKKMELDQNLTDNYVIELNKSVDLKSDINIFKDEVLKFIEAKKDEILFEIIKFYKSKLDEIKNNYSSFYEKIENNINIAQKDAIKNFFENANKSSNNLWDKFQNIGASYDLDIFNKYVDQTKLEIEKFLKELFKDTLNDIKKEIIISKENIDLFGKINNNLKFIEDIKIDNLNYDLNSPTSYVNIENLYHLLFKQTPSIVNPSKYSYDRFVNYLKDIKEKYLDEEKRMVEELILETTNLYNPSVPNYQGYHYPHSNEFTIQYYDFLNNFKKLPINKRMYHIYQYTKKGPIFKKFIAQQNQLLSEEKEKILSEVIKNNFYGYDFSQENKKYWWYQNKPVYIDELINFKVPLGTNASVLLKDTFLNLETVENLKENVKKNIVIPDLDTLISKQKKIFSNFWHNNFNQKITKTPIDYNKSKFLIEKYHFDFFTIRSQYNDNFFTKMEDEQNTNIKKYENIIDKSIGIQNSNKILQVKSINNVSSSNYLIREKDNIYSFVDSNKKEKYFLIGIEYGVIIVLKTNNLTDDIKNCVFTQKIIFDINKGVRHKDLDDKEIIFDDNKITIKDNNNKEIFVVKYLDFDLNVEKDLNKIKETDLSDVKTFYEYPNYKIVQINDNFNKIPENYTYYIGWNQEHTVKSNFFSTKTLFYKQNTNNNKEKNVVAYNLYNENGNLLIIYNFIKPDHSKQNEEIFLIDLLNWSYSPSKTTIFLDKHNIDYQIKKSNDTLKTTGKILPFVIGGLLTAGIGIFLFIFAKKLIYRKKLAKKIKKK